MKCGFTHVGIILARAVVGKIAIVVLKDEIHPGCC